MSVRSLIPPSARRFTLASPDLRPSGAIPQDSYANGFGCTSANRQVRLVWRGAPAGVQSYAVTMQDIDAPTSSGFWHWVVWDIPSTSTRLGDPLPSTAVPGGNDTGGTGYFGPCPPTGDIRHRYAFTVYALDVPTLDAAPETPPTVAAFLIGQHVMGYARLVGIAQR